MIENKAADDADYADAAQLISVIRVIRGLWFVGLDKFGLYRNKSAEEPTD